MIVQTITYYLIGRRGLTPGLALARYKASRRAGGLCELSGQGGSCMGIICLMCPRSRGFLCMRGI